MLYHSPPILYLQVVYAHLIDLLPDKKWLLALTTDNTYLFAPIRRPADKDNSLLMTAGWASAKPFRKGFMAVFNRNNA